MDASQAASISTAPAAILAVVCAAVAGVGMAAWMRPGARWLGRLGDMLGILCFVSSVALWIGRWVEAGHLPLFGTYESALSLVVAVLAGGLATRSRPSGPAGIWPVACAAAALLLAHGLGYDPTVYALTISERSWVVDIHAFLAWAAFGALVVNVGLAARRLTSRADDSPAVDRALAFSLSIGFLLHTGMMASGSFYKFLLFGTAWSFDPIETLGFVAWVSYGTLLHMHLFAGWEGRRLAWWSLVLFVLLVVSYRGIVYFPAWSTYHIFDMDLRIHLTGSEILEE
jgi:ABC-type transport system involved in cytochrome c biogenesis permease subunit